MLLLDIKVYDRTSRVNTHNFQSGCVCDIQNCTHLVNELGSAVVCEEITHLLVQSDGSFDTVHKRHSYSAFCSQNVLNVLPVVNVLVTAAF